MTISVVDAHTHVFSSDVIRDRAAYLKREPWFGLLYERETA
ncbi:MAG: amidohydrolase, partial [Thermomicrobiales bacterium]|nr:amidohydrolase [Thermomicrobiales bacterium]